MPMSRHARCLALVRTALLLVVSLLAVATVCSASRQFSTVAISNAAGSTLVCALVIPQGSSDDASSESGSGSSKLHCTSLPDGERMSYPSADVPYNAIAAGTDFLCGLMAPAGGHAAMRWWSFSEEAAANRSRPVGRRLYWGPSLRAMAAGGPHVCGLSDAHDPTCWEWPQLSLPKGLDFSRIALGEDFLCGVVAGNDSAMRCFGGMKAPAPSPTGAAFKAVAAGRRHACAVDAEGGLVCWGDGKPAVQDAELPADMWAMALGHNTTCILAGNGTVRCWGMQVPEQYAHTTFVAIEADGDAVCAVMMTNYSVVCWGNDRFQGRHLVYNNTMPGACAPKRNCPCDVISGSGTLCGNGGGEGGDELAVCQPCKLPLSRIVVANGMNKKAAGSGDDGAGGKKAVVVVLSVGGGVVAVLAALGVAFYLVVFKKWDRKVHVTVRLGESSSPRLCHNIEAVVMPAPEASPLPPARLLGCEEFTLKELSHLTNGRKLADGRPSSTATSSRPSPSSSAPAKPAISAADCSRVSPSPILPRGSTSTPPLYFPNLRFALSTAPPPPPR